MCYFDTEKERKKIIEKSPWSIKKSLLVRKVWPSNMKWDELDLDTNPFWIRVHNLPPNMMTIESVNNIGNKVGKFLEADK